MKVKSTNPIKKQVMAALKAKSGATKVTQVTQVSDGVFTGQCFKKMDGSRKFDNLGSFTVEVSESTEAVQ